MAVLVAGLILGYAFTGKSSATDKPSATGGYFWITGVEGGATLTCACGSTGTVLNGCKRLRDKSWVDCGLGPVGCYEGWRCW